MEERVDQSRGSQEGPSQIRAAPQLCPRTLLQAGRAHAVALPGGIFRWFKCGGSPLHSQHANPPEAHNVRLVTDIPTVLTCDIFARLTPGVEGGLEDGVKGRRILCPNLWSLDVYIVGRVVENVEQRTTSALALMEGRIQAVEARRGLLDHRVARG